MKDWIVDCLEYYDNQEELDKPYNAVHVNCICTDDKADLNCPYINKCFAVDTVKERIKELENKVKIMRDAWNIKGDL